MAYLKQWLAIQDYYVTFEDWNRLQDNSLDFRTQMDVKHGTAPSGSSQANYSNYFGMHDFYEGEKGVARVVVNSLSNGAPSPSYSFRSGLGSAVLNFLRTGVGQYQVSSFVSSASTAEVTVETTAASVIRRAEVRYNDGSTNGYQFTGWEILLLQWNSGTSSWDTADFTFNLAVWDV